MQSDITIVVPCHDEEAAIPPLLNRLDRMIHETGSHWEVVFVDDGSSDRTWGLLATASVGRPWLRLLRHERQKGLGAALRTAFAGPLAPVVCTIDSDCTYPPERLPELIAAVGRGADVVTASPWHPMNRDVEGGLLRVLPSRAVSRIYRRIAATEIHTFTCLFRAYRREVIKQIHSSEDGFAAVAEILVRATLNGYRVEEIPMPVTARRHGVSKMSTAAAVAGHLRLLISTARWMRSHRRGEAAART